MALYEYSGIASDAGEIRLLTVLPGRRGSEIKCDLHSTILSKTTVTKFEALSYTWGSLNQSQNIHVCRKSLSVTDNLAAALQYLRYLDLPRILWIDAICVNQQDLKERSMQVCRMADIFSLASRVVVWLGPESDDSGLALRTLDEISSKIKFHRASHSVTPTLENEPEWADRTWKWPYDERTFRSISCLLLRGWFERLWIWQEIWLANEEAVVLVGNDCILWERFRRSVSYLDWKRIYDSELDDPKSMVLKKRLQIIGDLTNRTSYAPLTSLASRARYSKCSDPRDRVYAFVNIMDDELKVLPDYQKTVEEVFRDVVLQSLIQLKSLDILKYCELQTRKIALPTWVPDWSAPNECMRFRNTGATADTYAQAVYDEGRVLYATGVEISVVQIIYDFVSPSDSNEDIIEILRKLVPKNAKSMPYVGGGNLLEAYCRTFVPNVFSDRRIPLTTRLLDFEQCKYAIQSFLDNTCQETLSLTASALRYLRLLKQYAIGRSFFKTAEGYLGLAPKEAMANDKVCGLLGCCSLLILRSRTEDSSFQVVGESYVYKMTDGEGIFGPLPDDWYRVFRHDEGTSTFWTAYQNAKTGQVEIEDPRLGPLPTGWRLKNHAQQNAWPWYTNDQDVEIGGQHWKTDPRMRPEELESRGVLLKSFKLV